jgi:hypothetical protein
MATTRIARIAAAAGSPSPPWSGSVPARRTPPSPRRPSRSSIQQGNVLEDSAGQPTMGFKNNSADERWIKQQVGAPGQFRYKNVATGRAACTPRPRPPSPARWISPPAAWAPPSDGSRPGRRTSSTR